MSDFIPSHFKHSNAWKRLLLILVFILIVSLIRTLLWAIIALQIVSTLLTGEVNAYILGFSRQLSIYLYHITLFLTFNSDLPPFPFSPWQFTEPFDHTES